MNLTALLAELIAHGVDIEIHDGVVQYVGDWRLAPASLLEDLYANHVDLERLLVTYSEEARRVH